MSVSTEVQRTLVKSPPELWSELSNPEALARHLAELGEIRITGIEPETKVEWEAEGASGVVHLKQSGWGTKVTLSLTREAPASDEPSEPEQIAEPEPVVEPDPEPEPGALAETPPEPEQIAEPEPIVEPEPEPVAEEPEPEPPAVEQPEPRRRFFARLFRRRSIAQVAPAAPVAPEPEPIAEPEPVAVVEPEPIEVAAFAAPEPIYPPRQAEPAEDLAAELASVEAQMAEETTELLTGVLDRLGAAHHRPFSRG